MSHSDFRTHAQVFIQASVSNLVTVPETDATTSITPRAAAPKM